MSGRLELPNFSKAIKENFDILELAEYFENTTRVGTLAHTQTDEEYEFLMKSDLFDDGETEISHAEDMLRFSQAKELLL